MFNRWGWYVVAVIGAFIAAFWHSGVMAAPPGTSIAIHSTPGPTHNPAPRFHQGPNSHPPHQHEHWHEGRHNHGGHYRPRPPVYVQPAPVYQQPPVYYVQPAPIQPPVRVYRECQRYDGWRQQYIYVPC